MSVSSGRCGPCCSVAPSGSTAIQRSVSVFARSDRWISDQSRGGTGELMDEAFLWAELQGSLLDGPGPVRSRNQPPDRFLADVVTSIVSIMGHNERWSP